MESTPKPHAVCVACPTQGHINPMLKLAYLLHTKGFFITFVNTDFAHRRLLASAGPSALDRLQDFRFATIPDGLPDDDPRLDIPRLCRSIFTTCAEPLTNLLANLDPPASCIVSDGAMSFSLKAAERLGIPEVLFWTTSASAFLCYTQLGKLLEEGLIPLRDDRDVRNGYLETVVEWFPGVKNMRLKDLPSSIRTTDAQDFMLHCAREEAEAVSRAKALILNTFDALERDVLAPLSAMFDRVYTVGPLHLMSDSANLSFWKEEGERVVEWLDTREPETVLYVNFGSLVVLTAEQVTEMAWGLASSGKPFLWVIRPDIVAGEAVPAGFRAETEGRGLVVRWCRQEEVLKHPAVGGFLTHGGWNSTLESIGGGVPVLCCPLFSDQFTNCRLSCVEWGVGMELESDVKREEVELKVRELMDMDGEKRKELRENAKEWKVKAEDAIDVGGSSCLNLYKLIDHLILQ